MSVKQEVLKTLEENRGEFFSGEELAGRLQVSRAAVWKAIKALETMGYKIKAVPNRGYCLATASDVLSVEGIKTFLNEEMESLSIEVREVTGSTNQDAKMASANGAPHGSVFVANVQTNGRGRRGRNFISLEGSSIYMSIILKPQLTATDAIYITTAASVAVYRAIKKVTKKETQIKWVNDLYYEGKKVCGILTEAVTDCETGLIDSIILGIGINFNIQMEQIPSELKEVAGALYHGDTDEVSRNQLIAEILCQVLQICMDSDNREFLKDYRENSMILGKEINILGYSEPKKATAIGIEDNGGLIVEYEDKKRETIHTGEVSIRLI
ncbi:biotin--[acetyl-CoA-carboxylase] ligase [Lachnoclostridium phytofermentans]|uniref:Bifunctional ligase/repressor BirA n=1 Tax=Lachnoclostridium phytofermentans (strain ATCC 700394 / DSM 18823 / ISDg) TaxID=357809 RepID=A9KNW9_LACP7|nr:biotin--[acetyl-CoA-carboxylase] ligase [Lachnoclostridium phytofermentans]ABX43139.1 biotin--acetyl-CoA-carboxylase ligase [Lachnoclostridium phytofermentans ISDg]